MYNDRRDKKLDIGGGKLADLHNLIGVPMNSVVVVISSWVKPWVELLLPVSLSLSINICVNNVRLS